MTSVGWKGNDDSTTTTLTPEALKTIITNIRRRGGGKPTCIILGAINATRLYEAMDGGIRYINGKLDQYDYTMTFDGLPVVIDDNVPDTHIFVHNKDAVQLHCMREINPDFDGAKKPGYSRAAVQLSQSKLTYLCDIWGMYQNRCNSRRSVGMLSALTA